MKTHAEIAKILRCTLAHRHVTQTKLRDQAGVSQRTLTKVLSGHEDFKVSTLLTLADRLGLELLLAACRTCALEALLEFEYAQKTGSNIQILMLFTVFFRHFLAYPNFGRSLAMRFTFQARQTRLHSPLTFFKPRKENWRNPITDLMMPNTGSTVCLRNA